MNRRTSRRSSRRRASRRGRRRVSANRRRTSRRSSRRRASRRRVSRNRRGTSRRGRKKSWYLHYKTPGGAKRVIRLGYTKPSAGQTLKAWQSRVRGKGYRIVTVFGCGGGIMRARKLAAAAA